MWALFAMPTPVALPTQLSRDATYQPGTTRAEENSHGTLTSVWGGRPYRAGYCRRRFATEQRAFAEATVALHELWRDGAAHCQCPECARVSMHGTLYAGNMWYSRII